MVQKVYILINLFYFFCFTHVEGSANLITKTLQCLFIPYEFETLPDEWRNQAPRFVYLRGNKNYLNEDQIHISFVIEWKRVVECENTILFPRIF